LHAPGETGHSFLKKTGRLNCDHQSSGFSVLKTSWSLDSNFSLHILAAPPSVEILAYRDIPLAGWSVRKAFAPSRVTNLESRLAIGAPLLVAAWPR